jgi:hypothetical protein
LSWVSRGRQGGVRLRGRAGSRKAVAGRRPPGARPDGGGSRPAEGPRSRADRARPGRAPGARRVAPLEPCDVPRRDESAARRLVRYLLADGAIERGPTAELERDRRTSRALREARHAPARASGGGAAGRVRGRSATPTARGSRSGGRGRDGSARPAFPTICGRSSRPDPTCCPSASGSLPDSSDVGRFQRRSRLDVDLVSERVFRMQRMDRRGSWPGRAWRRGSARGCGRRGIRCGAGRRRLAALTTRPEASPSTRRTGRRCATRSRCRRAGSHERPLCREPSGPVREAIDEHRRALRDP